MALQAQVVINEIAPNNAKLYDDEDNTYPDWIELVNMGPAPEALGGYALTDDPDVWNKWLLGNTTLTSGDKIVIFASAKNRDCMGCAGVVNEMHTNFKISYGEKVLLYNAGGILLDSLTVPAMHAGHSMARIPDGGSWCYSDDPSPDVSNSGTCYIGYATEPEFNTQPGFYTGSVNVTAGGAAEIRYTTDGDWPGFASTLYTAPISVTDNTVVKLTAIEAGKLPSRTVTGSFFIDQTTLLPVVSISSNSCDMFDEGWSCIAAYDGADGWEPDNPQIPAAVEYFTADKVQQFEKRIKFEAAGNSSIYVYPQRGMQFTCDEDFGETSEFDYNIFEFSKPDLDTLNGWRVRANNDWGNSAARMKDVIHNRLALPTYLVVPAYQNVATYINGEYWGHYSAREELDAYFLRNNLGVDPDSVDLVRSGAGEDVWDLAEFGTLDAYYDLSDFFNSHNMTNPDHYAEALTLIDKENWVDHFATQIFINNDEMAYNIRCFKSYKPDMKWKFILWDTGAGGECETCNSIQSLLSYPYLCDQINMMNDLLDNPDFELYFINRYADLMNYYFTWPKIEAMINENKDEIEEEIPAQYARWGQPSVTSFNNGVNELKGFFDNRAFHQRNEIDSYFDLGGKVDVTLDVAPEGAGYIKISTIIPETHPWTGVYFDDAPVQVTAIANPGYTFSHWDENAFIADEFAAGFTADISSATTFLAHFTGSPVEDPIVISEINYNSDATLNASDWVELHNRSDVQVDVSGWKVRTKIFYNVYTIPEGTVIPPDGFLVLAQDTTEFKTIHPDVTNFIGPTGLALNNDGDSIALLNIVNYTEVSFAFQDKRPWPITADGYGRTMEFPYYDLDPAVAENWVAGCMGGSPGEAFTPCVENPIVDEINYNSSPMEDAGDWFELYNWSADIMYLSFWQVRDKNGNAYTIPSGTYILGGGGRLVIYQDSLKFFTQHPEVTNAIGPMEFGYDGQGDCILLYDASGTLQFSVGFDDEAPYPLSPDGDGTALQLLNAALNSNDPVNWTESCPEGSPGSEFVLPCANAISETDPVAALQIYPNPGNALFNIAIPGLSGNGLVTIADATGKIIMEFNASPGQIIQADMRSQPAGMYYVRMISEAITIASVLIKQ